MSYIDDIIIPGVDGRVFSTKLDDVADLNELKEKLMLIGGVTKVHFNTEVFPTEVKIVTDRVVNVEEIQDVANDLEVHLIKK
ncbi:hypothetical protein SAMN05216480_101508 [Pustulibacterium marinum]|uniref:Heavy-metal-associated domain-containing protein n=1 Tax=Pustulibacterium marinum TaxID=1224947 RepID=A0A1I7F0P2_9FLAO|nr:hypothetical protein [Pustulibacterium marinum]SFU29720.1 hypothetical protein SAMN05216480_101508 [Pustulibacterium marinum]